jgi:hypothetical protein
MAVAEKICIVLQLSPDSAWKLSAADRASITAVILSSLRDMLSRAGVNRQLVDERGAAGEQQGQSKSHNCIRK